jgi:hypothetical protein
MNQRQARRKRPWKVAWKAEMIIKMGYGEETLESFAIFSFALSFVR